MQKQKKKTALTESQVKLKKYLKPIVEGILSESAMQNDDFLEFLDRLHREFKGEVTIINSAIERAKQGKNNAISDVIKKYFNDTKHPDFGEAIKAIIDFRY